MVSDAEIEGASGSARMIKLSEEGAGIRAREEARAEGAFGSKGLAVLGGGGLCA